MTYLTTSPSIEGLGTQLHLSMGLERVLTIQDKRTPRAATPVSFGMEVRKLRASLTSHSVLGLGVEPLFALYDPEQLTLSSEPQFPHM